MESSWYVISFFHISFKISKGVKNTKTTNFSYLKLGVYFSMLLFKIWKIHSILIVIIFRD